MFGRAEQTGYTGYMTSKEAQAPLHTPSPQRPATPVPVPPDPLFGKQIGNVKIVGKLGQGGFGTVYHAEHIFVGIPFALKVLKLNQQANAHVVARFQREARALAQLKHPNIVQFYDFGELPEHGFYMVMEYLDGESLSERLRFLTKNRSCYSLPATQRLFFALCDVLHYIHRKGLIHRDLKPSNVFFHRTEEGDEQVRLLDFGIVAIGDDDQQLTETGVSLGTASYISPEQARGKKDIDGRSDLYALGVLLFRILTNRPPFRGDSAFDTIMQHLQNPVPTLREKANWKPWSDQLEAFIQRSLAKDPNERPKDAMTFKAELMQAFEHQQELELRWMRQQRSQTILDNELDQAAFERYISDLERAKDNQSLDEKIPFVASPDQDSALAIGHMGGEQPMPTGELDVEGSSQSEPTPWSSAIFQLDLPDEKTEQSDSSHIDRAALAAKNPGIVAPPTFEYREPPPANTKLPLIIGGLVLVLLVGGVGVWLMGSRAKPTPPKHKPAGTQGTLVEHRPQMRPDAAAPRQAPLPSDRPPQTKPDLPPKPRPLSRQKTPPKPRPTGRRKTPPKPRSRQRPRARVQRASYTRRRLVRVQKEYLLWRKNYGINEGKDLPSSIRQQLEQARRSVLRGRLQEALTRWLRLKQKLGQFQQLPAAIKKRKEKSAKRPPPRRDPSDFIKGFMK